MRDAFVAFDVLLRSEPPTEAFADAVPASPDSASEGGESVPECPCRDALGAVRRFRASLADALDAARDTLLHDVACDVLGRELRLAPADIAAIVTRALERYANDVPVRVRVHPSDVSFLADCTVNVAADSKLRPGDVAIDVRAGTIDASLGARLACALARV
jgi:hypothetical protein